MIRRFFRKREQEQVAKRILNSIGHKSWTSLVGKKWSQEFKLIYFSPACLEILEFFSVIYCWKYHRDCTGHGKPGKIFLGPGKSWNLVEGLGKSWKIKVMIRRCESKDNRQYSYSPTVLGRVGLDHECEAHAGNFSPRGQTNMRKLLLSLPNLRKIFNIVKFRGA